MSRTLSSLFFLWLCSASASASTSSSSCLLSLLFSSGCLLLLPQQQVSVVSAFTSNTNIIARRRTTRATSSLFGVRWDPAKTAQEADKVFVEFPTEKQRKTLRKEVAKIQARKELPWYTLSDDLFDDDGDDDDEEEYDDDVDITDENETDDDEEEDDDYDYDDDDDDDDSAFYPLETLEGIWNAFHEKEMEVIQIRGISKNDKKNVYKAAEQLAYELEELQSDILTNEGKDIDTFFRNVTLLSTKGHSAILYCPILDMDHRNKIVLRTSVGQKNVWKKRVKPPRDIRGQIIPKELREELDEEEE